MHIIIRASGERTEKRCIELARNQGTVHVIRAHPFGESIRQTYKKAIELKQEFIPVIDADVLLLPRVLSRAILYMNKCQRNVFCLDGKTKDKIMMKTRRAGIHIYRTSLLPMALKYVEDGKTKPESHVRKMMSAQGYKTVVGHIVFGYHDYEQWYIDLWRKSVCQSHKLAGMIRNSGIRHKWHKMAKIDNDYRVILAAHAHGNNIRGKIIVDARIDYGAAAMLKKLGIKEKGEL